MCRNHHSLLAVAMIFQLCWTSQTIAEETDWVRVVPKETDEILANPGMGWETFHKPAKQDEGVDYLGFKVGEDDDVLIGQIE